LFILTALALKDFKSFEEEASCAAAVEAAVMVSLLGKMVFDRYAILYAGPLAVCFNISIFRIILASRSPSLC
jgi:hypothetical protein